MEKLNICMTTYNHEKYIKNYSFFISIGDNVFINNCCIIEHDNIIKSHAHLTPGVITGGTVSIGNETFIGLGSRINDHTSIGDNCTIGSGSVVTDTIDSNSVAVGVPAKVIKKLKRQSRYTKSKI